MHSNSAPTTRRLNLALSLVALTQFATAQTDDIYTQASNLEQYYQYGYYAVGLFVLLIVGGLIAKATAGRRTSSLDNITGLNVTGLAKEGLLTPEEAAAVRSALSRQIKLRMDHEKRLETMPGGEIALLNDPEIKVLEQKAEQKASQGTLETKPLSSEPPGNFSQDSSEETNLYSPAQLNASLASSTENTTTVPDPPIEIPADILELHSTGVITDEDLENWKRRARAARQE